MVQRRKCGALAGGCSSWCSESAAPGQIISLSVGTGRRDWQAGPALEIRACDIQRNLFIPKAFCVFPNTPTDRHYRNLFIFPWKAAISREEYGSFLQRCFRMSCSEVYSVPISCFSSSLVSALLVPPAPHFKRNLLKSLFFHPVPAVSSLILLPSTLLSVGHHYSLGLITATQPSFPLTLCPQRDVSLPPPSPHFLLLTFLLLCSQPSVTFRWHLPLLAHFPPPVWAACLFCSDTSFLPLDSEGLSGRTLLWPVRLSLKTLLFNYENLSHKLPGISIHSISIHLPRAVPSLGSQCSEGQLSHLGMLSSHNQNQSPTWQIQTLP